MTTSLARISGSAIVLALAACTEPRHAEHAAPAPTAEARLTLSDSLAPVGGVVRVSIAVSGTSIASATARITYDTLGLQYVDDAPISDAATRVSNPTPGLVRVAAVAPQGFTTGEVYAAHFIVRRTEALRSIRLVLDELHTSNNSDLAPAMTRRP